MLKIQAVGGYLEKDEDGYLLNNCAIQNITGVWLEAVEDLVSIYKTIHGDNLHSVYLRGSVPKGNMIDCISDIDSFCLIREDIESHAEMERYSHFFQEKYPVINGVEIDSSTRSKLFESQHMRFLLKTQCLCIWGDDETVNLENMTVSAQAINTCLFLAEINDDFVKDLETLKDADDAIGLCSWIFKLALRAAFEIVMMREQKFTRDIYFCWVSYTRYYPENNLRNLSPLVEGFFWIISRALLRRLE